MVSVHEATSAWRELVRARESRVMWPRSVTFCNLYGRAIGEERRPPEETLESVAVYVRRRSVRRAVTETETQTQ